MKSNNERVSSILKKVDNVKNEKRKLRSELIISVCCLIIVATFGIIKRAPISNENEIINIISGEKAIEEEENENILFSFNTKKELYEKISKNSTARGYEIMIDDAVVYNVASEKAAVRSSTVADKADDYSKTNIQVDGVDEADIVKTNGEFIYYLNGKSLLIFDARNEELKLVKEISFDNKIYANELMISDEYVIVFANSYDNMETYNKIIIYDTNNFEKVREIDVQGNYLTSRKIGDYIYLITNKSLYYVSEDDILPRYYDTAISENVECEVPVENIKCFPNFEEDEECSYLMISSINLKDIAEEVSIQTFVGTGRNVYCSNENLYVAKVNYNYLSYNSRLSNKNTTKTIIRKFSLKDGMVKFDAEGEVEGSLLNQFSMDEYDGYFRITTTVYAYSKDTSNNNLFVLDNKLKVIGSITGLAAGEKIYSTRFMGDKCYVVTYKTVDPLFVIDLSDPEKPTVLGELKIPGYSSYLHPFRENYLIGLGEDSVEKIIKNYDGTESVTAYSTGLKLAIFDISDFNNPKEVDSVKIGGRGSYSESLNNHKSILFRESDGLFAFPASLYDEGGYYEDGTPKYGKKIFEGFVVFNIDEKEGISLKGEISNDETISYKNGANRIIYIKDKLYSLFREFIKVNDIETLEEVEILKFND